MVAQRELEEAPVRKRGVLSMWTSGGCSAVPWHEGVAAGRAALSLHLISSRLGHDSPSGLELRTLLGFCCNHFLLCWKFFYTLEPLGSHPDGPSAVGLSKSPTLYLWVQNACLVPPTAGTGGSLRWSTRALGVATVEG